MLLNVSQMAVYLECRVQL